MQKNRKQLIIVPPMSEALRKLNEVLVEIADAEKIEIKEIEEAKSLNRMMSSGQSLVIFSNSKNCVLFLQENKFLIAKFRTKVILLVPKEMPGKLLNKFLKSGLTEAVFEGAPPKTLLHKVKMHLRSIKSDSFQDDDNDQVVTSMLNPNKISNAINDISSAEKNLAMFQDDSLGKNNSKGAGAGNEKKGGWGAGHSLKENTIGTNWNSKRQPNSSSFGVDNNATSFKNKREKNIYYQKKKKDDLSLKSISEYICKKTKSDGVRASNLALRKLKNESMLSLNSKDKSNDEQENDSLDPIVRLVESMGYGLGNKSTKKEFKTIEDDNENTESDQDEADVFSADIQKKINKNINENEINPSNDSDKLKLSPEDENKDIDRPGEDAGYRIEKKSKKLQKVGESEDLTPEDNQSNQDDDEIKLNKINKKSFNEEELSEEALDDLSSLAMENMENDHKIKKTLGEEEDSKKKKSSEENTANFDRARKSYVIVDDNDDNPTNKKNEGDGDVYDRERKEDVFIDMSGNNQERKSSSNVTDREDEGSNALNLDDQESTDSNNSREHNNEDINDTEISLNKENQESLDQDKNGKNNSNRSKVNNLDASVKVEDPKKSGYSWDNLVDKDKSMSFDVRRKYQPQVDMGFSYLKKNISEQTIDYSKIKKEFDKTTPIDDLDVAKHSHEEIEEKMPVPEEKNPKQVIELDVRGIEFCVDVVKLIYNKDTVDLDYFIAISKELIFQYKAYTVFYTYETSSNKHLEAFNAFTFYNNSIVSEDLQGSWLSISSNSYFDDYFTKTMPTWQCRNIQDKAKEEKFWEDVELPRWASRELANKKIELVFPYFDGVDLMGTAIVFFPEGINASREKSIIITLETARTVFLNTIQRNNNVAAERTPGKSIVDKIKILISFVYRFFNSNKEDS